MRVRVFAIALVAALLSCGTAVAETLTVTSTEDDGPGTLAQTILDAGAGDEIRIPAARCVLREGCDLTSRASRACLRPGTARPVLGEPSILLVDEAEVEDRARGHVRPERDLLEKLRLRGTQEIGHGRRVGERELGTDLVVLRNHGGRRRSRYVGLRDVSEEALALEAVSMHNPGVPLDNGEPR